MGFRFSSAGMVMAMDAQMHSRLGWLDVAGGVSCFHVQCGAKIVQNQTDHEASIEEARAADPLS